MSTPTGASGSQGIQIPQAMPPSEKEEIIGDMGKHAIRETPSTPPKTLIESETKKISHLAQEHVPQELSSVEGGDKIRHIEQEEKKTPSEANIDKVREAVIPSMLQQEQPSLERSAAPLPSSPSPLDIPMSSCTSDLHISFQMDGHLHDVDLKPQVDDQMQNSVMIGGFCYSLQGGQEAIKFLKECLDKLPQNSTENLDQTAKELKARLWQEGAKEISLTTPTHKIGLTILGSTKLLDVHQTVKDICTAIESCYVFPDVAKKCSKFLKEQLENGSYDSITDPETFAQTVTADLRLVSEDKHIVLEFDLPSAELPPEDSALEIDRPQQYPLPALVDTCTYKASTDIGWMGGTADSFPHEIKSGYLEEDTRIGYIDMRIFGYCGLSEDSIAILKGEKEPKKEDDLAFLKELKKDIDKRRPAIIDAVNKLNKAESVIIDLRNNRGGNPYAVQLLCSLFIEEGLPLNTIEWRNGEKLERQSFNTLSTDELPMEKRLTNPRVFVLIGPQTFSAAEEFANNMKVLGRATIVGTPSGGGANPGGTHIIGEKLRLFIPSGHAINPIQEGNWEGVGIIPDQYVPAEEALEKSIALIKG